MILPCPSGQFFLHGTDGDSCTWPLFACCPKGFPGVPQV